MKHSLSIETLWVSLASLSFYYCTNAINTKLLHIKFVKSSNSKLIVHPPPCSIRIWLSELKPAVKRALSFSFLFLQQLIICLSVPLCKKMCCDIFMGMLRDYCILCVWMCTQSQTKGWWRCQVNIYIKGGSNIYEYFVRWTYYLVDQDKPYFIGVPIMKHFYIYFSIPDDADGGHFVSS